MRRLAWMLLPLLLAACVSTPRLRPADAAAMRQLAERETALRGIPAWQLQGRLAVSVGGDGGSGRIQWVQNGDGYRIRVSAPVSRRSWELRVGDEGAVLDGLEGGPYHGADARALLRDEIGWDLPLASLSSWVRGMRADPAAKVEFADDGRPARILESGWQIDYRGWSDAGPQALPTRVFAERSDAKVRLIIDRWQQGGP